MDMISLHDIQKSYGSHQVLKNVDLTIRQGEIYGLIGKNGAGKTTIFNIILGLTDFENGRLSIAGKWPGGPQGVSLGQGAAAVSA